MEELKPGPSQWDAAVKYLNAYRNSHYADALTEESYWLADAINTILPSAVNSHRRTAPENKAAEIEHKHDESGSVSEFYRGTNKPLTLDQLRQMDGKPVYVVYADKPKNNGWRLVKLKHKVFFDVTWEVLIDKEGKYFKMCDIGYCLTAYARKPEQEDTP